MCQPSVSAQFVCVCVCIFSDLCLAVTLHITQSSFQPLISEHLKAVYVLQREPDRRERGKETEETNEGVRNRKRERKEERNNKGHMKDGQNK